MTRHTHYSAKKTGTSQTGTFRLKVDKKKTAIGRGHQLNSGVDNGNPGS